MARFLRLWLALVVADGLSPRGSGNCFTADEPARTYRLDLDCLELPAGQFTAYVRAVGEPFMHNPLSAPTPLFTR